MSLVFVICCCFVGDDSLVCVLIMICSGGSFSGVCAGWCDGDFALFFALRLLLM